MRCVSYKAKGQYAYDSNKFTVPEPGPGELLIKVEAAVLNPCDLVIMEGGFNGQIDYPCVLGSEGSGTVVAYGSIEGWYFMGKRVAFSRKGDAQKPDSLSKYGAFAEYVITDS